MATLIGLPQKDHFAGADMRTYILLLLLLTATSLSFAQQEYVSRYDAFAGYSYLESPKINLAQRGFNVEFGVNVTRWLAIGGDYSWFDGHTSLNSSELTDALQQQLALIVPPGFQLSSPFESITQTLSAGPQINIRALKPVTFFVRPALGALHERVTLKPSDPLTTAIVIGLVGPSRKKTDTVVFYGFGGGIDFNTSKHVAIRLAADFVHTNLFEGLLREGRNSVRMSIGPSFRFGRNVE